MKIAILSLNPGHNYGGILQSYALKVVLERMGHKVQVITKERPMPALFSFRKLPHYGVRLIRRLLGKSNVPIFAEYYNEKNRRVILKDTLSFCGRNLQLKCITSFSDIKSTDYDAFVVGSDQVWRPKYFEEQYRESISNAYLEFTKGWNVKRIAYAPSFGTDAWEYDREQTAKCGNLLNMFDAVSAREEAGVRLCKERYGIDADLLCDPTMLLKKEDYEDLVPSDTPVSSGNLLVYCLDKSEELDALVSKVAKDRKLNPFSINGKNGTNLSISEQIKPSVESWIRGFIDAKFVITDSFHACVFSLIFQKPFVVLGNKERGMSRFETLLNVFGQTQRLLYRADDYDKSVSYPSLEHVDEVFSKLRGRSFVFLNDALQ